MTMIRRTFRIRQAEVTRTLLAGVHQAFLKGVPPALRTRADGFYEIVLTSGVYEFRDAEDFVQQFTPDCLSFFMRSNYPGGFGLSVSTEHDFAHFILDLRTLSDLERVAKAIEAHTGGREVHILPPEESPTRNDVPDQSYPASTVFIGHGHSRVWRSLAKYLQNDLRLKWTEFDRDPAVGLTVTERLHEMLAKACFAILVMTAENIHDDQTVHARENVIHEIGFAQGRLGPKRVIILLEAGCAQFTNILGLIHIPFQKGKIAATFPKVRAALKDKGIV
jgi:predicted nucleotide-binding protein